MSTATKECVLPEDMIWEDCQKVGHEEGCYVMVCPHCKTQFPDCEGE